MRPPSPDGGRCVPIRENGVNGCTLEVEAGGVHAFSNRETRVRCIALTLGGRASRVRAMNPLLAELGIVCPRCDAYNAPQNVTCTACNTALGFNDTPGAATRPGPAQPMPAPKPTTNPSMQAATAKFKLTVVKGTVNAGSTFKLAGQSVQAGRTKGLLLFPNDTYVAPLHCTFFYKGEKLFVRDESGPSGTFVTISKEAIPPNTFFLVGDSLMRYLGPLPAPVPAQVLHYGAPLPPGPLYLVEEILEGLRPGRCVARVGPTINVGQTGAELVVAGDASVAAKHCEISVSPQGAQLRDLSSPTGTFMRIAPGSERELRAGDQVRLGNEILKVEAA